jgi:DNA-binding transcriptional ArsR family regulator
MTASRRTSSTLARALAHPTRRRILQILRGRVASPRVIADDLGEPIGRVSHHVRWLAAHGYLELVRTEPRRGALEHFYRASIRAESDEEWSDMPSRRRAERADALLHEVWGDVLDACDRQGFEAEDAHLSRTRLELDAEGRRELGQALEEVLDTALRIERRSRERLGGQAGRQSELAVLRFDV